MKRARLRHCAGRPPAGSDRSGDTVTLKPREKTSIHHAYRLEVNGTGPDGAMGQDDILLDGADDGSQRMQPLRVTRVKCAGRSCSRWLANRRKRPNEASATGAQRRDRRGGPVGADRTQQGESAVMPKMPVGSPAPKKQPPAETRGAAPRRIRAQPRRTRVALRAPACSSQASVISANATSRVARVARVACAGRPRRGSACCATGNFRTKPRRSALSALE
jgi:hypothetical protein